MVCTHIARAVADTCRVAARADLRADGHGLAQGQHSRRAGRARGRQVDRMHAVAHGRVQAGEGQRGGRVGRSADRVAGRGRQAGGIQAGHDLFPAGDGCVGRQGHGAQAAAHAGRGLDHGRGLVHGLGGQGHGGQGGHRQAVQARLFPGGIGQVLGHGAIAVEIGIAAVADDVHAAACVQAGRHGAYAFGRAGGIGHGDGGQVGSARAQVQGQACAVHAAIPGVELEVARRGARGAGRGAGNDQVLARRVLADFADAAAAQVQADRLAHGRAALAAAIGRRQGREVGHGHDQRMRAARGVVGRDGGRTRCRHQRRAKAQPGGAVVGAGGHALDGKAAHRLGLGRLGGAAVRAGHQAQVVGGKAVMRGRVPAAQVLAQPAVVALGGQRRGGARARHIPGRQAPAVRARLAALVVGVRARHVHAAAQGKAGLDVHFLVALAAVQAREAGGGAGGGIGQAQGGPVQHQRLDGQPAGRAIGREGVAGRQRIARGILGRRLVVAHQHGGGIDDDGRRCVRAPGQPARAGVGCGVGRGRVLDGAADGGAARVGQRDGDVGIAHAGGRDPEHGVATALRRHQAVGGDHGEIAGRGADRGGRIADGEGQARAREGIAGVADHARIGGQRGQGSRRGRAGGDGRGNAGRPAAQAVHGAHAHLVAAGRQAVHGLAGAEHRQAVRHGGEAVAGQFDQVVGRAAHAGPLRLHAVARGAGIHAGRGCGHGSRRGHFGRPCQAVQHAVDARRQRLRRAGQRAGAARGIEQAIQLPVGAGGQQHDRALAQMHGCQAMGACQRRRAPGHPGARVQRVLAHRAGAVVVGGHVERVSARRAIEIEEGQAAQVVARQAWQRADCGRACRGQPGSDLVERVAAGKGRVELAIGHGDALGVLVAQLGGAGGIFLDEPDAAVGVGAAAAAGPGAAAVVADHAAKGIADQGRTAQPRAIAHHTAGIDKGHAARRRRLGVGAARCHRIAGDRQAQAIGRAVEQAFRARAAGRQRCCTA